MSEFTRIEFAREPEAVDFVRFLEERGLRRRRNGTTVEILEPSNLIGDAITTWVARRHSGLVPTKLPGGDVALHPPAA